MSENIPVLAICLPTCDRGHLISTVLESFLDVPLSVRSQLEFCISNNASTDDTQKIIESYAGKIPIKVYTQPSRVSFSKNAYTALQIATAEWRCLIGDDDILEPNYLKIICHNLKSLDSKNWVLVPSVSHDKQNFIHLASLPSFELGIKLDLLLSGVAKYGFIGCHIISKRSLHKYSQLPAIRTESYWFHQLLFLSHIGAGLHLKYFPTPYCSIIDYNNFKPYRSLQWTKLWFSRFNSIYILAIWARSPLLILLFLRTYLSSSQVKELIKLVSLYTKSAKARLSMIAKNGAHTSRLLLLLYYYVLKIPSLVFFRLKK